MEYVIITLVTISSAAFVFYWLANRVFGYTIKFKSLLLCGGCAVLLSLVVPRVIVSYAGFVGTLTILSVIAVVFAYFVAYYDNSTSNSDRQTPHTAQGESYIDMEIKAGVANKLSITPDGTSLPIGFSSSMDKTDLKNDKLTVEEPLFNSFFDEINSQSNNEDAAAQTSNVSNNNGRTEELLEHRSICNINFGVNDESDVAPLANALDETNLVKPQFSCVDGYDTDHTSNEISMEVNGLADCNILTDDLHDYYQKNVEISATVESSSLDSVGEITEGFDEGNKVRAANEFTPTAESNLPTDIFRSEDKNDLCNDSPTVEKPLIKSMDSDAKSQSNIEDDIPQSCNDLNSYDRTKELSEERPISDSNFGVNDESDVSHLKVSNKAELLINSQFLPVEGELSPATNMIAENNVLVEDSLTIHTSTGNSVEESNDKCGISQKTVEISVTVASSAMNSIGGKMSSDNKIEERKGLFNHLEMYEIVDSLPVALDELMEVAFRFKENNNLRNALVAFKKTLNLYPNCDAAPSLIIEIGTLQKNAGHFDEAINTFSEGRRMAVSLNDCVLEKEFIDAIAYLRIVKNALVKNRMFGIPFKDIPNVILREIDEEFTEWRSLANII